MVNQTCGASVYAVFITPNAKPIPTMYCYYTPFHSQSYDNRNSTTGIIACGRMFVIFGLICGLCSFIDNP